MSILVALNQFREILFLEVHPKNNIGLHDTDWFFEMEYPDNLYLDLYFYVFVEEQQRRIGIVVSIDVFQ